MTAPGPVAALRVLVVEDDMLVAFMLEDYLEQLRCTLAGIEMRLEPALAAAQAGGFDFALLDINLNGAMSWPVADVLVAAGIPFAFATGYRATVLPERFAGLSVLAKPFGIDELAAVLGATGPL
ncbi:response regulator [Novosphingobium huizhouense]|uniref:response regulator n=1 Tax=Novosphingobium huizhouense TaxID=2866625 RepID=UPI001CD8C47F|nr:response regulator [Novosphingobium huizhouense]